MFSFLFQKIFITGWRRRCETPCIDPKPIGLPDGRYWIVVNREQRRADRAHPIPQTYVDTCLVGCLETGGEARARAFIQATELWDAPWINDRDSAAPLYPRRTPLDAAEQAVVDRLLLTCGVLKYRQPA